MKNLFFRLYLFATLTFVALGWSIDKLYNSYSQQADLTSDIDLHKGTLFLIHRELSRYPQAQWQTYIQAIEGSFGYPLQLVDMNRLDELGSWVNQLSAQQRVYLQQGGVVSVVSEQQSTSWFLQKRPEHSEVIVLGPIVYDVSSRAETFISLLFLAGLALSVFIWVWPLSRGLVALTKAAERFGKGELGARVTDDVTTPLRTVSLRFNAMAARIERLITSHKELSHAVSHELRTPIARIRFAMEMVREVEDKAQRERYLNNMDDNIEELDMLVDELLTYAKFDREEPPLNKQMVDLCQLSQEVLDRFCITHGHLQFTLHCAAQPCLLSCDKDAIQRVLDNLIRNAIRYAKQQVVINLDSHHSTAVTMAVSDDGPGIPESDRQHLFEPFVRLDQSRDRNSGGIGLGLAIVKRYISLHQGTVRIKTATIGGACFTMWLPKDH